MRSERIGKNALKITVSGTELKNSGFTQKEIFSEKSGEFVKTLLQRLIREGGVEDIVGCLSEERPTVEVVPTKDKGCVIYISSDAVGETGGKISRPQKYAAIFFEEDSLLKAAKLLCREFLSFPLLGGDTELWADMRSALLIFRLTPRNRFSAEEELSEYTPLPIIPVTEHIAAAVSEHYTLITDRNAAGIILDTFGSALVQSRRKQ